MKQQKKFAPKSEQVELLGIENLTLCNDALSFNVKHFVNFENIKIDNWSKTN